MISPQDIQKKALRHYKGFLTAVLKRDHFFPLTIKGNKGKASMPLDELFPALKRLLEGSKSKKGFGYTVTLKAVQTRHAGEITMPDEIFFENVEDYLKFIEKEKEFLAFRKVAMQSQKQLPQLMPWMEENPLLVLKHLSVWQHILKVGGYFLANPNPQKYTRALPIDIPAIFIENHTGILTAILNAILPNTAIIKQATIFEERFGLLYEESLIRIRGLEQSTFPDSFSTDISLPISSWKKKALEAKTILVITDKVNFLRFPLTEGQAIIWGKPSILEQLKALSWLTEKTLFFWGDISNKGFQGLASLRQGFPQIQSFLMDKVTFEKHQSFAIKARIDKQNPILRLNKEEQDFLQYLSGLETGNSLEQKHISQSYLLTQIAGKT